MGILVSSGVGVNSAAQLAWNLQRLSDTVTPDATSVSTVWHTNPFLKTSPFVGAFTGLVAKILERPTPCEGGGKGSEDGRPHSRAPTGAATQRAGPGRGHGLWEAGLLSLAEFSNLPSDESRAPGPTAPSAPSEAQPPTHGGHVGVCVQVQHGRRRLGWGSRACHRTVA